MFTPVLAVRPVTNPRRVSNPEGGTISAAKFNFIPVKDTVLLENISLLDLFLRSNKKLSRIQKKQGLRIGKLEHIGQGRIGLEDTAVLCGSIKRNRYSIE